MRKLELKDLIEMSVKTNKQVELDCSIPVEVENETWQAYTASVSYRDILLFTDKGTVTFLVDSYGDRHVAELFDWDRE